MITTDDRSNAGQAGQVGQVGITEATPRRCAGMSCEQLLTLLDGAGARFSASVKAQFNGRGEY